MEARRRRDEAKKNIAHGIDPGTLRKAQKQADTEEKETFEVVAREWYMKFLHTWVKSHADKTLTLMEKDLFPWIGKRPISDITPPELLAVLRRIESRGALDTAHRARGLLGRIFRYAVSTGRAERDQAADLRGALPPPKESHHAAITAPKEVAPLLRDLDGYQGLFVVKCALGLAPMLFVRPGELRQAEWLEIDLDEATWNIPAEKMKMKEPHLVPLPKQAVNILKELKQLTGTGKYVFPSGRSPS